MNEIKSLCKRFEPVGSRVTCNPAPTDTDEDFLALVSDENFNKFYEHLMHAGYELGGSIPFNENDLSPDECFCSFALGDINIIATESDVFFDRFMIATAEATRLNLLVKADRIALFQSILYAKEST